jgi:ribosomal protein S18 acetylase RimI-like enzyme
VAAVTAPPPIRRAAVADAAAILPLAIELYALEELGFDPAKARGALDRLLADPSLGFAMVAAPAGDGLAGYAVCTFGYDLEFGGRDAYLTEILVASPWRGRGLGDALLAAVEAEAVACDVHALHLLARADNAAGLALYHRRGYVAAPRTFLSKRLAPP